MPDPKPAPRIVVWESDACAGVISGRSCADCDDGDCEHECHHSEPAPEGRPQTPRDVPDEMVRIATEGLMGLEVRRVIVNIWPEIERRVREQVAAEIEARGFDLRGDNENPISREEWACYGDAASIARGEAR